MHALGRSGKGHSGAGTRTMPGMDVVAVVPVGSLESAKSRLGAALDAEERRDLVLRLLERTVAACLAAESVTSTIVVSPDPVALAEAERLGARTLLQADNGLNEGVREARALAVTAGATAILIVPVDLPLIGADAIEEIIASSAGDPGPTVGLVSDRHGRGTNALLIGPPGAIEPCFGGDSAAAHRAQAMAAGARLHELDGPLTLDLDTTDDLLLAEELAPRALRAS